MIRTSWDELTRKTPTSKVWALALDFARGGGRITAIIQNGRDIVDFYSMGETDYRFLLASGLLHFFRGRRAVITVNKVLIDCDRNAILVIVDCPKGAAFDRFYLRAEDLPSQRLAEFGRIIKAGLVPVVVQNGKNGLVLMHDYTAWSAYQETLETERAVFHRTAPCYEDEVCGGGSLFVSNILVAKDLGSVCYLVKGASRGKKRCPVCYKRAESCFFRDHRNRIVLPAPGLMAEERKNPPMETMDVCKRLLDGTGTQSQ